MSEADFNYSEKSNVFRISAAVTLGILFCAVSVYAGYLYGSRFDPSGFSVSAISGVREFLLWYFNEIKLFCAVFLSGFTIFAPAVSAAVMLWRSAEFGCALFIYLSQIKGEVIVYDSAAFVSLTVSAASLVLLLIMSLASILHARTLRYAIPDTASVLSYPETRGFISAFFTVSSVLLLIILIRTFSVPLLL